MTECKFECLTAESNLCFTDLAKIIGIEGIELANGDRISYALVSQ